MNWEDEGYIVSKRKFRENALIIEVFTKNYGKVSGIVYGGTSRKIKNHLQILNKIYIIYNSKGDNKIGYFKTELIEPISPKYFNNKVKIICINSISSILKVLLPENEVQKKIYTSLGVLFFKLNEQNWVFHYLKWELNLIRDLGYGIDLNSSKIDTSNKNKFFKVKLDNIEYQIPTFIINGNSVNFDKKDIFNGLVFTRHLMENKFFLPNNLRLPQSRVLFEKKILN